MKNIHCSLLFVPILAMSLSNCDPCLAKEHNRLAIPDAESHKTTIQLVRDIYKEDFVSAKSADDKLALAQKLLEIGLDTNDDNTARYVLFGMSRDVASENGDIDTAMHAIEQMENAYEIDGLAERTSAVTVLGSTIRSNDSRNSLVLLIREMVNEASNADRYDLAKQLADLALVSARKTRDATLTKEAIAQVQDIDSLKNEFSRVQDALAKLQTMPTDPDANRTVGRFYCLTKGDWNAGCSQLALGSDPTWKAIAEKELTTPTQYEDQVSLGDDLWALSLESDGRIKRNIVKRALYWYSLALPNLSGLTKARVQKRLDASPDPKPSIAGLPKGTVVAFDFERGSFKRRGARQIISDLSNYGGDGEIENGELTTGKHGTAITFRGDGYLKFADKALPKDDAPRSIMFWIRIDHFNTSQVPFGYGSPKSGDAMYLIVKEKDDSQGRGLKLSIGNYGGQGEPCGQSKVTDGRWHHVGFVYDGSGKAELYIDGKLEVQFARRYHTSSTGDAFVGSDFEHGSQIIGAIDDFIILDRVASSDEIIHVKDKGLQR